MSESEASESEASESEIQQCHSPVEGEWPGVVRPLPSLRWRPNFKTRKSLERTKILLWVPTRTDTKNDFAGEAQEQFTGLDWYQKLEPSLNSLLSRILTMSHKY
jgi:hypothetical protein